MNMEEEIQSYKVDEDELDQELDQYNIDEFLINEVEKIEAAYQTLEFRYHALKAKREALYGT